MVTYFTRYVQSNSIAMLSPHYSELMRMIKENEGNKCLKIECYMLHKVLDKIKETTDIDEFDDTKILINTYDELPDNITLKKVVILRT